MYLSIDQGGSSSRAFVADKLGNILASGQCEVSTICAPLASGESIEQSPNELVASIFKAIEQCLSLLTPAQVKQIEKAALVTQRSSFVAIKKSTGECLSNIISWQDTRAQQVLDTLAINSSWLNKITGLRASGHYGASKMRWLLEKNQQVINAAKIKDLMFLPLSSYLINKLTVKHSEHDKNNKEPYVVDPANASRTLLFDIENLCWHNELIKLFGLSASFLPQIKHTLATYGALAISKGNIELSYVNGDQSAAIFSQGLPNTQELLINIGTGAFISQVLAPNCSDRSKQLLKSIVHSQQQQNLFVIEGTVNGAGSAIDQIKKSLGIDAPTPVLFKEIAKLSADEVISAPIFINTIGGLAAPFWRTDIDSSFIQQNTEACSNIQKLYAVLESIVFLLVEIITILPNKKNISAIHISGGLANNKQLCQMLSDITQLRINRNEIIEASVLGSLWWLAGQPDNWLPKLQRQDFSPQKNASLKSRYSTWQRSMHQLLN